MQKNGFFITFEGGDGSGKTTIINMVYQQLLKDFPQKKIILTREPGASDNPLCVEIRNLLLNKDIKVDHRCEALLFAADRAQHVGLCLKPSLEEGALILCDRYIDSSIVYQGFARKLGVDQIWKINEFAMQGVLPDLTLFLMVRPEISSQRINNRLNQEGEHNRIDKEKEEFHKFVYDALNFQIKNDKLNRIVEINAEKTIDEVFCVVYEKIKKLILKNN